MNDETGQTSQTSRARRARARMADRARLPWWYATWLTLTLFAVLLFIPGSRLTHWWWMTESWGPQIPQLLMVVAVFLGYLVTRVQGMDIRRTLTGYPSATRWGLLTLGVFILGMVGDYALTEHGLLVIAFVEALVVAVVVIALGRRHFAAVRRDIRDGRVTPP